jgi:hypothetical protein
VFDIEVEYGDERHKYEVMEVIIKEPSVIIFVRNDEIVIKRDDSDEKG